MFSTNFAYFVSFLTFVFFAYKYGHKKMKGILDQKIQGIANALALANQQKEEAQLTLNALKQDLQNFQEALKKKDYDVQKQIEEMNTLHIQEMKHFISEREKYHFSLLDAERNSRVYSLKQDLVNAVLQELRVTMANNPEYQSAFQKKVLGLLEKQLLIK